MPSYTRPFRRRLPKRSKTLPVFGKGDDKGRYFRCWNCGFICDTEVNSLGDAESNAGDEHTDYHGMCNENPYGSRAGSTSRVCCLDEPDHYHVALRIGADSEPKTITRDYISDISRGCPFCGSVNYRGDY